MIRIPVALPDLSGNEENYVVEAIRSTWISSTGPFVQRFEKEFAELCGVRAAISVCNGTVALHLALLALDVRPGDEVLVPSLTYIATANAVRYVGAEPVFVDVNPNNWCIDPGLLEASITRRTKGIIAVHLYGHPADMDAINHIAAVHGLWVVEDAAEAHLARYKGHTVGGLGHIATFSFYGNKIFTCGEGGALTVKDPHLELRIRTLRGQGMDPQRRYYFPVTGYNFRLTNVACAILCAQLERHEQIISHRRKIFSTYRKRLEGIPGIGFQPAASWAEPAPWLFCITVNEREYGHSRNELMSHLAAQGIELRPFFIPLHQLPPFREESRRRGEKLPVTDLLGETGLNLPTFAVLSQEEQEEIADIIMRYARPENHASSIKMEIRKMGADLIEPLTEFFECLNDHKDNLFFHPHPLTHEEAVKIANYEGDDLYYVLISDKKIMGYAILRGWDEGYEIPSLGIVIHYKFRGRRLGETFMNFLHSAARLKGAAKIRLKVYPDNAVAINLYKNLGYTFQDESDGQLVGILTL